jgi:ketosteroid isomerase-like protein
MQMLKKVLFLTMVVATMGACAPAPAPPAAPPDTSADEAKLKSDLQKWFEDMAAGNFDAVAAQYADNSVLMPPNQPAVSGRTAVRESLAKMGGEMKAGGVTLKNTGTTGIGVTGDMAWMSGTYAVSDAKGTIVEVGKYLSVHKKTNGAWLYIRDTWNADAPPPPPAAPAKGK